MPCYLEEFCSKHISCNRKKQINKQTCGVGSLEGASKRSLIVAPLANAASASSNHSLSNGRNLHMFLKDKFSASKRDIVVCEKSVP